MEERSEKEKEWSKVVDDIKRRANTDQVFFNIVKMLSASKIEVTSNIRKSNLINSEYDERFRASLMIHHFVNGHKLDKKGFEYSFRDALNASGHKAVLDLRNTNPGADISVDSVPFSLKTEGSKGIREDVIHISKLMESAWMKGYKTLEEFHESVESHILAHLSQYERMLTLRAFPNTVGWRYQLVEIPLTILRAVANLTPRDLTPLTKAKGTGAPVKWEGEIAWYLKFDGSDDKITVAGLQMKYCQIHAEWFVKLQPERQSEIGPETTG